MHQALYPLQAQYFSCGFSPSLWAGSKVGRWCSKYMRIFPGAVATVCVGMAPPAHSHTLPEWEIGLGVATIYTPDYRGAEQSRSRTLPIPFLQYRGARLRVDEGGVRGRLFGNDDVQLDLSIAGGVPVNSKDNLARQGMADLSPTLEIGPEVAWRLWTGPDQRRWIYLKVPARAALTVTGGIHSQGYSLAPYLEYVRGSTAQGDWKITLSLGPQWGNARYHQYIYGVPDTDVTATRPAYSASAGYSGSRLTLATQKRHGRWWMGGFVRYDDLHGAVFNDSPLVKETHYLAAGVAVAWVIAQSQKQVEAAP